MEDVQNIDVNANVHSAKALLESGHLYLDVSYYLQGESRTKKEFEKSHMDNAINIPYMFISSEGKVKNPEFLEQVSTVFTKESHLIVGCNSGCRSVKACNDLLNAMIQIWMWVPGFKNLKNMEGGYAAWVDSGFVKEPSEKVHCLGSPID